MLAVRAESRGINESTDFYPLLCRFQRHPAVAVPNPAESLVV
jgi:hypothetical protein